MTLCLAVTHAVEYLVIELTIGQEGGVGEVGIRWGRVGQGGFEVIILCLTLHLFLRTIR